MQNLYISAPTLSQYGALAAFDDEHLNMITNTYQNRRDYLYNKLSQLFTIDAKPEGAFYIWANISQYSEN
jgi:aspartate/methionine/tyrosine aminotransferase